MPIRGETKVVAILAGVTLAMVFLVILAACSLVGGGGDSYYYPQDRTHGYYDTNHHYHYYPKYDRHSKSYVAPRKGAPGVKVKPAPKSGGGWKFNKSGGSKSGGFKSSRR